MFEQDRFIVRLQQSVMRESDIEICFLTGAHGRRTEDAYSDLDVVFVFPDTATRDSAWERRRDFTRSILPYVPARSFDADHLRPHLHVALYGNGAKVDYRYEARDEIAPQPEDRELRILKDSDNWAENYQAASARIIPTQPRMEAAELERIDARFWGLFWDVFRQLLRGDARTPFRCSPSPCHPSSAPCRLKTPPTRALSSSTTRPTLARPCAICAASSMPISRRAPPSSAATTLATSPTAPSSAASTFSSSATAANQPNPHRQPQKSGNLVLASNLTLL
jgi:hypothetical protein